jgi:phage terminase small subunit
MDVVRFPTIDQPASALPPTPTNLSPAMAKWWLQVVSTYQLEPHHLLMLEGACRAWDRAVESRVVLAKEGLSYADAKGRIHPRPEANMERQAMLTFARLLRELDLDMPPPAEKLSRPPGLKSNRTAS